MTLTVVDELGNVEDEGGHVEALLLHEQDESGRRARLLSAAHVREAPLEMEIEVSDVALVELQLHSGLGKQALVLGERGHCEQEKHEQRATGSRRQSHHLSSSLHEILNLYRSNNTAHKVREQPHLRVSFSDFKAPQV